MKILLAAAIMAATIALAILASSSATACPYPEGYETEYTEPCPEPSPTVSPSPTPEETSTPTPTITPTVTATPTPTPTEGDECLAHESGAPGCGDCLVDGTVSPDCLPPPPPELPRTGSDGRLVVAGMLSVAVGAWAIFGRNRLLV